LLWDFSLETGDPALKNLSPGPANSSHEVAGTEDQTAEADQDKRRAASHRQT
jgi:hypothetical protein